MLHSVMMGKMALRGVMIMIGVMVVVVGPCHLTMVLLLLPRSNN